MRRVYPTDAPLLVVDIEDSDSSSSSVTSGSGRQTPELSSTDKKLHRASSKTAEGRGGNVCARCCRAIFSILCMRSVGQKLKMVSRHLRKLLDPRNLFVLNVLVLLINLFFLVMQMNKGFWPVETYFQPVLTPDDKQIMMQTLKMFMSTLAANNITVFMYGGTLIGSYRHHGFIPWDDDADIIVNASEKQRMTDVFASLEPDYKLYTGGSDINNRNTWKFYSDKINSKFIHKQFKWPYVDIFFFNENATHIYDEYIFDYSYVFPKNRVFPLVQRPFMDTSFPAPCDTKAFLDNNYEIDLCRSRSFSHMMEVPMFTFSTKDVPCSRLYNYFPFVERTSHKSFVNETLRMADWTLGSLSLPVTNCNGQIT